MKKNKHIFILLLVIVLLANLPSLMKTKHGAEYFSLYSAPDDVWTQYFYIKSALTSQNSPDQNDRIRQRALWGYAIASLALVDSNFTNEAELQLALTIDELKKEIEHSGNAYNPEEAILFLHYNLFDFLFPGNRFHNTSDQLLLKIMERVKEEEKYFQRVDIFSPTTIQAMPEFHLGLLIHDRLNQTDWGTFNRRWQALLRKIPLEIVDDEQKNILNWNVIFLSAINPALADSIFRNITDVSRLTSPKSEYSPALLYAAASARAVQDTSGFAKLIRKIRQEGKPYFSSNKMNYQKLNLTENIFVLFAKVCRFYELFNGIMPQPGAVR